MKLGKSDSFFFIALSDLDHVTSHGPQLHLISKHTKINTATGNNSRYRLICLMYWWPACIQAYGSVLSIDHFF